MAHLGLVFVAVASAVRFGCTRCGGGLGPARTTALCSAQLASSVAAVVEHDFLLGLDKIFGVLSPVHFHGSHAHTTTVLAPILILQFLPDFRCD